MKANDQITDILRKLNDNRNKLSALFSLYNSSLISAEDDRAVLSSYYEQMIDFKNNLSTLTNDICALKKSERTTAITKNRSKIKQMSEEVKHLNNNFKSSCSKYKIALKDCGSLKTEYKHEVSELCKEFKSCVDENTPNMVIKGYKQQIRIIKAILDRIEGMVSDYNVKKNKVEQDNERFGVLYENVNALIDRLQAIA